MTTTGDRIRRARLYRGLSALELARKVGYATQSGIANLENRATGRGGFKLVEIAQTLDVSLQWLLHGPDALEMENVAGFMPPASQNVLLAQEPLADAWTFHAWPFKTITPAQWAQLTRAEQALLERQIHGLLG